MMALGELKVQEYFAQLYAHVSVEQEPASAGRLMIWAFCYSIVK